LVLLGQDLVLIEIEYLIHQQYNFVYEKIKRKEKN